MKNNETLQKDVQNAIKWEPLLNAAEIGVTAKDGVVTLTGVVDSYTKKLEAEDAAKNVAGVKAVVEKIEIDLGKFPGTSDNEIASAVLHALTWNFDVPNDKVKVKVEDGRVTLEGELAWNYQKEAAKKSVDHLIGVKAVVNKITIKSETHDEIQKRDIEEALVRNWSIDDRDITVKVSGHTVTLSGTVDSWYQKEEAARIAWKAPGVWALNNDLVVEYEYSVVD
ncbi:MAG: BON domain-containing protein [Bacteroidia bacterium]